MSIVYRQKLFLGAPLEFTNQNSLASNQWFGITAVVSHTLGRSAVMSTGLVAADSIISLTTYGQTTVKSLGAAANFVVSCISPGGFFRVEDATSHGAVGSLSVAWVINNPR